MMTSGGEIRKVLLARGKQMIQNFWESSPSDERSFSEAWPPVVKTSNISVHFNMSSVQVKKNGSKQRKLLVLRSFI